MYCNLTSLQLERLNPKNLKLGSRFTLCKYRAVSYKGFTLAEVLITLLIIGVVGSLVIPSLIQNTQDAENKTAWKKVYGEIAAATQKIMMDNGGTMKGALVNWHTSARDQYLEYLGGIHKCDTYTNDCGDNFCSYFLSIRSYNDSYGPDPSLMGNCSGSGGAFAVLNNGAFFQITSAWNGGDTSTCDPYCAKISVDVNGFKGPNRWGKDIFGVFVMENSIKPYGYAPLGNTGTCQTYGYSCSLEYLSN